MADVSSTVQNVVGGIVSLIKGLIVLFVFANIVYDTGFDPVYGIINLVDSFLSGGFAGLLALLVLVSLLQAVCLNNGRNHELESSLMEAK